MKRKSFSVFFWISVVLVAILLFFVMGATVEGFGTICRPAGNSEWCNTCPPGQVKGCNGTKCTCTPSTSAATSTTPSTSPSTSPSTTPSTSPSTSPTKKKTPVCSTGHYINGKCSAVA